MGGNNWASGLSLCSESCTVTKGCVSAAIWKLHGRLAFCCAADRTGPPPACPVHSHSHLSSRDIIATGHDTGPVRSSSFFASDSSVLRLLLGFNFPVSVAVRYILSCCHGQTSVLYVPFGGHRLLLYQWLQRFLCTRLHSYAQT